MDKKKILEWTGVATAILYSLLIALNIGAEFIGFSLLLISAFLIGLWAHFGQHRGILFLQLFYATAGLITCCAGFNSVDTISSTYEMGLFNAKQYADHKDHANGKHQAELATGICMIFVTTASSAVTNWPDFQPDRPTPHWQTNTLTNTILLFAPLV